VTSTAHSAIQTTMGQRRARTRQQWERVRASALVLAALVLGVARQSHAQTNSNTNTTTSSGGIRLTESQIDRVVPFRETGNKRYWISYSDCVLDDAWSFPLNVTNTSLTLEVWAGTSNCVDTRPLTDRQQCWLVAKLTPDTDSFRMTVPVRNVVARRLETDVAPTGLSDEVCNQSEDAAGESFTYYFMQVSGGQVEDYTTWDGSEDREGTGFDMIGPRPPDAVRLGIGESQLDVRMSGIAEEADRERFRAFCVPAGTAVDDPDAGETVLPPVDDAGTDTPSGATDAGTSTDDDEIPSPAECANGVLFTNRRAPVNSPYECGTASVVSSSIRTDRLQNGVTYAVAVAGEDAMGNAGKLSDIRCGTPTLLDDFFEIYSRNGGPGGGGFCSVSYDAASRAPLGGLGLGALGLLLALRRRRSS
jgi:MYXO-CTERM domain-containing protein